MKSNNNTENKTSNRTKKLKDDLEVIEAALIPKYKIEGCQVRVRLRAERPKY